MQQARLDPRARPDQVPASNLLWALRYLMPARPAAAIVAAHPNTATAVAALFA